MPADPTRVQKLFLQIVELPLDDRSPVLQRECGADIELRQRIEALLKAHEDPDDFLDQPGGEFQAALIADASPSEIPRPVQGGGEGRPIDQGPNESEPDASPASAFAPTISTGPRRELPSGEVIAGRYRLQEKIGEGGMGEVWVATQTEPVKRKVALKLIKAGMDSKAVVQRFEQERQALALMDHPHIARVFDGGITDEGRPFFVMELVNGLPLTKFCDGTKLGIRERLELFIPICQAVQHAHQKGVIHRDLKPSNILVTMIDGRPIPKIIDFGVAKATGGKLTEETMSTQFGAVLGTLEYMSPEQAVFSGADVDTRADIYSLGVILYELLTGLKPFDSQRMKCAAFDELIRIVREEEPSKPSTRLSTDESLPSLAAMRQMEPARLKKLLRGELDCVVMKCLEKQRDRRYETANALARDVQRYLADETVEARPPTAAYRLKKLLRRNKGPVLAASLVFLALVGGVVGTTVGLYEAKRQEGLAIAAQNKEAERADSEAKLAEDNASLAESEREASTLAKNNQKIAEGNAAELKAALAQSYFRQGLREYDAGRPTSALADLTRALAMTPPENPLYGSYRRVLIDRCLQGGKQLLPPLWHAGPVRIAAFSLDGTRIVTGSRDMTARVWDASTGAPVGRPMPHERPVDGVAFSPDGTRVITRSGSVARLWEAHSGLPVGAAMEHENIITSAAFSPEGTHIVTGSNDKTARLWDAHSGAPFAEVMQHDASVYCVAFSPDGRRVVTGIGEHLRTGIAQLWDSQTAKPVGDAMRHANNIVWSVAFSSDGKRLLTGSQDWTVRVWDAETGGFVGPKIQFRGPIGNALFSPDGTRILTSDGAFAGYVNYSARLWDSSTGAPIGAAMNHEGTVRSMAFSPDGTRVVTASNGYSARLWDAYTGAPLGEPMIHQGYVAIAAFSPDGTRVLTGSDDNTARLWNAHTGTPNGDEMPHEGFGLSVAFSHDGTRVVTGSSIPGGGRGNGTARVWDAHTGAPIGQVMEHDGRVWDVGFSPDGMHVVTGSGDFDPRPPRGLAQLWNAHTGVRVGEAMRHNAHVWQVAFSPDGTRIVTGSIDGTARLWDAHTGTPVGEVMKHAGEVKCVAFSPDGTRVVTGSTDFTARLWDAHTGAPVGETMRHESSVSSLAFSPDGTRVVTGSSEGIAREWDADTGTPLGEVMKHEGEIKSVAYSPDGTRVVTGSHDFTARLWDAHTGAP